MSPFVDGTFVVPDVPFPVGTKVRPKRGPDAKYVWTVYDHHGVTWPEGENVSEVILIREPTDEEVAADRDPLWAAQNLNGWKTTTWGQIEAVA